METLKEARWTCKALIESRSTEFRSSLRFSSNKNKQQMGCDCVNGKGKWELLVAPAADVKLFIRDRLLGFVKEKERTSVLSLTPSSGLANHHRRIKDGFDCQIVQPRGHTMSLKKFKNPNIAARLYYFFKKIENPSIAARRYYLFKKHKNRITELDEFTQADFRGHNSLNRIQSRIFHTIYYTNENILAS
ncbi:unnamed protein product [Prunus brigantina]